MSFILAHQQLIQTELVPLINKEYILLDLPYHLNIGDLLIWEGERIFLQKKLPESRCLQCTSFNNFHTPLDISKNTTILLHGGGNWGDIWKEPHNFKKKIISLYPENPILVFPQTIHYDNIKNLEIDADFFQHYPNVTICARDISSYNILEEYFPKNGRRLLPDMAFFMDIHKDFKLSQGEKTLFARRKDKECSSESYTGIIPSNAETYDWPTFEENNIQYKLTYKLRNGIANIDKIFKSHLANTFTDYMWEKHLRQYYIQKGINFLIPYQEIYTTRLHIGILGILMGKKVHLLDNYYGKLSNFYQTWLSDIPNVSYKK